MFYLLALVLIVFFLASAIRVLKEYERGVIFRLGRVIKTKGPGLIMLIPVIDKMVRVSLRLVALDVPPQDVITKDNVSIKVNAVVYYRVMEADKSIVEVENYAYATSQLAQTTLRSVCGQAELDELLAEREKISVHLQEILDKDTDLSEEEWVIFKTHPVLGANMVGHIPKLEKCADGIRHHHEMYDGTGYPYGLKGEDIPLEARILAIASVFDVVSTRNDGASESNYATALEELKEGSGTKFDPYLVEKFVAIYEKKPVETGGSNNL